MAVNLPLSIALFGLITLQYEREMDEAISLKQSGLDDEAIAIRAAADHLLQEHSPHAVQHYIDAVCGQMRDSWSPQHHIAVRLPNDLIHAAGNEPESEELLAALEAAEAAGRDRISFRGQILVTGESSGDGIGVVVSESLTNIRRSVRREVLIQVAVLGLLGLAATGIVNLVLARIVSSPLRRLVKTVEQITSGNLKSEANPFGSREIQKLSLAINQMSHSLESHDRERRAQMAKARSIQQHLLPNGLQIPGLRTAHLFEPADEVGGDFYDFVPLPDGSWLVCIADVTGHGVPAAMGAAMLKTLLLATAEAPPFDPVSVLQAINQRFVATVLPGNFATMFLARWQPSTSEFSWSSAGHDSGILLTESGRVVKLPSSGLPLGVETAAEWEAQTIVLAADDRILLYSDGVTETRGPNGDLFGRERLVATYSKQTQHPPGEALIQISRILNKFRGACLPSDDVTLVELHCREQLEMASVRETHLPDVHTTGKGIVQ